MAIKFTEALENLERLFPEYKIPDQENIDLAYIVYADFADFVVERIEKQDNLEFVNRVIQLINREFEDKSADDEYLNLLQIEFFENFAQSMPCIEYAREHLNKEARTWFEQTLTYTGLVEPDPSIPLPKT